MNCRSMSFERFWYYTYVDIKVSKEKSDVEYNWFIAGYVLEIGFLCQYQYNNRIIWQGSGIRTQLQIAMVQNYRSLDDRLLS